MLGRTGGRAIWAEAEERVNFVKHVRPSVRARRQRRGDSGEKERGTTERRSASANLFEVKI